jgi:uncharacterized protein involved in exopolysaccharide biosynthesis
MKTTTTPSIRDILRLVFRRKWALLIPFAAGVIAIAPLWKLTPSQYRAVALVQRKDLAVLQSAPASLQSRGEESVPMEVVRQEILTRSSLDAVLASTGLGVGLTEATRQGMHQRLLNSIKIDNIAQLTRTRGRDMIQIAATYDSPFLAKNIANAIADAYKERSNETESQDSNQAVKFLTDYVDKYRGELLGTEKELEKYRQDHFTDLPEVKANLMSQKVELQKAEATQSLLLDDATKRLAEVEKQLAEVPEKVQSEVTTEQNPRVAELQNLLNQRKTLLDAVLVRLTDEHPTVKQLRAEIDSTEKELAGTPQRLPGTEREAINPVYQQLVTEGLNLQRQVQGTDAALLGVRAQIGFLDKQIQDLAKEDKPYSDLLRQRTEKTEYYTQYNRSLVEARTKLQLAQGQYGTHVDILQYAIEPARPYYVPRVKLGLACIVGGIALGIALMFGLEFCDSSFRNMEDAAAYLDVPILGSICTIAAPPQASPLRGRKLVIAGVIAAAVLMAVAAVYVWNEYSPGGPRLFLSHLIVKFNNLVGWLKA